MSEVGKLCVSRGHGRSGWPVLAAHEYTTMSNGT
jgi:hypothetical protein